MDIFIPNAGEIAIKAVGGMADILTVIGQIIFYVFPREDLTEDWQKNQIILFTWLHLNVSFSAYRKDCYGSNLWRYNRVTINCLNNCWNFKYEDSGKKSLSAVEFRKDFSLVSCFSYHVYSSNFTLRYILNHHLLSFTEED